MRMDGLGKIFIFMSIIPEAEIVSGELQTRLTHPSPKTAVSKLLMSFVAPCEQQTCYMPETEPLRVRVSTNQVAQWDLGLSYVGDAFVTSRVLYGQFIDG